MITANLPGLAVVCNNATRVDLCAVRALELLCGRGRDSVIDAVSLIKLIKIDRGPEQLSTYK